MSDRDLVLSNLQSGEILQLALLAERTTVIARSVYREKDFSECRRLLECTNELQHTLSGQIVQALQGFEGRRSPAEVVEQLEEIGSRHGCSPLVEAILTLPS
jgi:hypothetical protein